MNIKLLQKLQKGRRIFLNESIQKSGTNNFKKFKYWELKDLIPCKQAICEKLQMETVWDYKKDYFRLSLYDLEQDDTQEPIEFTIPVVVAEGKSMMDMQDKGGVQTYAERYLLQQLFDIVDNDVIDSRDPKPKKPVSNKKKTTKKETVDKEKVMELAHEVGNRLYDDGRKPVTKTTVAKECDKMIQEGLMNSLEKREVVNLVQ